MFITIIERNNHWTIIIRKHIESLLAIVNEPTLISFLSVADDPMVMKKKHMIQQLVNG